MAIIGGVGAALPAVAQVNTSIEGIALSDRSPVEVILYLISWLLGILALLAVTYVLYGGFIWMTSGGNEDKIEKAKQILRNGLIGFVIVMSAWGIVLYLIGVVSAATGTGTTVSGSDGCVGCSTPGGGSSSFYVKSHTPESGATDVVLCTAIQATFSEYVDKDTVTEDSFNLRIVGGAADGESCSTNASCSSGICSSSSCSGTYVPSDIQFGPGDSTDVIVLVPENDYESGVTYLVTIEGDGDNVVKSEDTNGDEVDDRLTMDLDYTWTFTTGSDTDDTPPQVEENSSSPFPADGEADVCTNTVINFDFNEAMLSSSFNDDLAFVVDYAGTEDSPEDPDWADGRALSGWTFGADYDYVSVRPDEQLDDYTNYAVRLYGGDTDDDLSGGPTDMCGNPLDGDADGTAEGDTVDNYYGYDPDAGETEEPITWTTGENAECTPAISAVSQSGYFYGEYAGLRDGEACSVSSQCASNSCVDSVCDGYADTDVTITGLYLIPHPEVEFEGSVVYASEELNTCFDSDYLGNVLTNTSVGDICMDEALQTTGEIYTQIPVGSGDSNVVVTVAGESSEAASDEVDVQSPHITSVYPDDGAVGQYVTLVGEHFGTTVGTVVLRSADGTKESAVELPAACGDVWDSEEIVAIVPETYIDSSDGLEYSWATDDVAYFQIETSSGKTSDLDPFTYSDVVRPNLCSVSPNSANTGGASFTLTGDNFGAEEGDNLAVWTSDSDPEIGYYGSISSWSDLSITGTTASELGQDKYWVTVYDAENDLSSNGRSYTIPSVDAPQVVEISACDPDAGIYPHPNPTPDQADACINAMLGVIFDSEMDESTYTTSNIYLEQYNTGESLDESYGPLDVTGSIYNDSYTYTYADEDYEGFQYIPVVVPVDADQDGVAESTSSYLQGNTWYKLTISTSVTNTSGVGLGEAYTMTFKTDDTEDLCEVSTVEVSPESATLNQYIDSTIPGIERQLYTGTPYAGCNMLNSSTYSWDWEIDDEDVGNFGVGPGTDSTQNVFVSGGDEDNEGTATVNGAVEAISDDAYFTVDLGFCESDEDCASCSGSVCNEETSRCTPVVDSYDPESGQQGTYVTINGCMFGGAKGTVYFNSTDDTVSAETDWPAACDDTWNNTQIIVEVPEEYDSDGDGIDDATLVDDFYNLEVETQYGDSDEGSDTFEVNDTERPGICQIIQSYGEEGDEVEVRGKSLGVDEGYSSFLDDDDALPTFGEDDRISGYVDSWSDTNILTYVAIGAVSGWDALGQEGYFAIVDGGDEQCAVDDAFCSNALDFTVSCNSDRDCGSGCCGEEGACLEASACNTCETDDDCDDGTGACTGSICSNGACTPVINDLSPSIGPNESPTTVQGCYFGSYSEGNSAVTFDGVEANILCSNTWSNNEIIVEVPDATALTETNPAVQVIREDGEESDTEGFIVADQCSNGAAVPADGVPILCDLTPGEGAAAAEDGSTAGEEISFSGEEEHFVAGDTDAIFYDDVTGDAFTYVDADNITAEVANGAETGDSTVQVQSCPSNGLDFGVSCENSAEDCPEGSWCVDGACESTSCGACLIANNDSADSICGEPTGACFFDSTYGDSGDYCCTSRPTIEEVSVEDGEADVCPNSIFSVQFSERMTGTAVGIRLEEETGPGIWSNVSKSSSFSPSTNTVTITPSSSLNTSTNYRLNVRSETDGAAGNVRSYDTQLHLQGGTVEYEFTTSASTCLPDSVVIEEDESGEDSNYIFTERSASTSMSAIVYDSTGNQIQQTGDLTWTYSWNPTQEDSCDQVAWVDYDADDTEAADSETQTIQAGVEHGEDTSIEVDVIGTGSDWSDTVEDDIMVTTYFCDEDEVWYFNDDSSGSTYADNAHAYPQNFRLIYCLGDDVPEMNRTVINEGTADDDWFLQYLFLNTENEDQAFSVRIFENTSILNPLEWYDQFAPNPGSATETTVDGYAAVVDGGTYYVAASNIIFDSDGDGIDDTSPGALYNNMFVFTFNDAEGMDTIASEVMSYIRFNTNINYAECEGSDKQKLIRDTKRITDLGQIAALANDYYDDNGQYPEPQSDSFGSYISTITTSAWNSWQGALGNLFGKTLQEDPYNFFYASDVDEPWDAQATPWEAEEGTSAYNNGEECRYDPDSDLYYDETGTCWDPVNNNFFCPENSHIYLYRRDDADDAYLYGNFEYLSTETEDYVDDYGINIEPCAGESNAECDCFNFGITSENSPGNDWQAIP